MTLHELLIAADAAGLRPQTKAPADADRALGREVRGVAYDSRRVSPGAVFVAIRGERADGLDFVPQALANGATAIVADRPAPAGATVPWTCVTDARLALAVLSAHYFGHPSRALRLVGTTGTNGKTTTSYLIQAVLEAGGFPCGLIGTVQYAVAGEFVDAPRTTPEAADLQDLLRRMVDAGATACSMEVSSHALALHRVDATTFAAAVFTNLTRDHLDFHGDMDRYFEAKRRLFTLLPPGAPAIINVDDRRGEQLAATLPATLTYGLKMADVRPEAVSPSLAGLAFDAVTPGGRIPIRSRLMGQFNLYNLLAAVATGEALGIPHEAIAAGLAGMPAVPGRMQLVSGPEDDVTVVVDYAHSDDALRNILEAVRPLVTGRLITIFGCGGDRDRTKRPLMGVVAARLSDFVVLTSDNPRSEDPERILDDIERGIAPAEGRTRSGAPTWRRQADRHAAIDETIAAAAPSDVIVIAGKGHEKYQVVGATTLPFDDAAVARAALARRRGERAA
jgi:UDP-N-acetylmuramoyl-L-alanyl-D-glutamate--2,6-diaminopimelate ligase